MTIDRVCHDQITTKYPRKAKLALSTAICVAVAFPSFYSPAFAESEDQAEVIRRVAGDINLTPDHACTLPEPAIRDWIRNNVNAAGLMDDIGRTVFNEQPDAKPRTNSFDDIMRKTQQDSQLREADAKAIYGARSTNGQTPVGVAAPPSVPNYRTELYDIKAVARVANGLNCSATVWAGALRFAITYDLTLNPNDREGWDSKLNTPPFTLDAALSNETMIRVHYGETDLTLAEARLQSRRDQASGQAAGDARKREADAQAAYRNSPAGRMAALRRRQVAARKQQSCEANGGTWGIKIGSTIVQIDALTSNDVQLVSEACYFLGK